MIRRSLRHQPDLASPAFKANPFPRRYYMLTPRLSLKVDAKRLVSHDVQYDPALKAFLGLGWRF